MKTPYLGVIEGFFGQSWSFQERYDYADFLKDNSYQFYIYAPKNDPYLRKNWQQDWPEETAEQLISVIKHYHELGLDFGIGLSPFEIYIHYNKAAQKELLNKIERLNLLNIDVLCLLFDDMRGDTPNLASTQIQIIKDVLANTTAKRIIICPTYYSFDPVLEKVFGTMPKNYLQDLGTELPKKIDVFWTGPKVCSNEYSKNHLQKVEFLLNRKPFLWDNYPVNDGAKMCQHLHLQAFENRPSNLAELTSGHAVNPMNQPYLSRIPLQTLAQSYTQGDKYNTKTALQESLISNCDTKLAKQLSNDIKQFHTKGLGTINMKKREGLINKYQQFNSPYATEITAWLKGNYTFDPDCLTD